MLTLQEIVTPELHDIYYECSRNGWDGCEADPINNVAFNNTLKFVQRLPKDCPVPDILPISDGSISLVWGYERKSTGIYSKFSLNFNKGDTIRYFGIFNAPRNKYRDTILQHKKAVKGRECLDSPDLLLLAYFIKKVFK